MRIQDILLEKVTIPSPIDPWVYAQVEDGPEGVQVHFYRKGKGGPGAPARLLDRGLIDAPFHVVVDHVHKILAQWAS